MVCKDVREYSELYLELDGYRSYGDMSLELVESKNRTTFTMNLCESSMYDMEPAKIKNASNFVTENSIEVLIHGSVDNLVYYTNKSAICLINQLSCKNIDIKLNDDKGASHLGEMIYIGIYLLARMIISCMHII